MFNKLFGKKEKAVTEVLVAEPNVSKRQYPKEVEAIHNEFFTAGDNILQEATCLLKQLEEKDLAKGKRLAALGFSKTREAVVAIETENKLATTKEIADLVMYYKVNYPNNKFITEAQVEQICEKYGLVCGETSMYKGFVPENKLFLIEQFKLKKQDVPYAIITDSWHGDEVVGFLKEEDIISNYGKQCILKNTHFYVVSGTKCRNEDVRNADKYRYLGEGLGGMYEQERYLKVKAATQLTMKICAPLKDMEIPSTHKVNGYKIQHIPDPVVLQPVNGGYLVVACWGDEASDEIVVNQDMN